MLEPTVATLNRRDRRRGLRLAIVNVSLWSIGNSLTSGVLMIYFAQALGAKREALGIFFAVVAIVGLVRLIAPWLIEKFGSFKKTAVLTLTLSFGLMTALPLFMASGVLIPAAELPVFIGLTCIHQLLENLGTVALWTWLAQLVPPRIRGRYFGHRDFWKLLAVVPVIIAAGLFADRWREHYRGYPDMQLWGFAIPITLGGLFLLASVIVLYWMPEAKTAKVSATQPTGPRIGVQQIIKPLGDQNFLRLLLFGCWGAFFNGFTQSPQGSFPYYALQLGTLSFLMMRASTSLGQAMVSPTLGKWCDRFGNRTVIAFSQVIAASGMLFYLPASKENPWWFTGAWIMFIAYAGVNLGLNNLMLKLAPPKECTAYVANLLGFSAVSYALGSLTGGYFFQMLWYQKFLISGFELDDYGYMFYIGWITRMLAIFFLFGLNEPGTRPWREMFAGLRAKAAFVFLGRADSNSESLD